MITIGYTIGEEIISPPDHNQEQTIYRKETCLSKKDSGLLQLTLDDFLKMNTMSIKMGGGLSLKEDFEKLMGILLSNYELK